MLIRNEVPTDITAIRELVYAAFKDHPHHEPGAEPTEHEIVDTLRKRGELALSLVAEDNGQVVVRTGSGICFNPKAGAGQWFPAYPKVSGRVETAGCGWLCAVR